MTAQSGTNSAIGTGAVHEIPQLETWISLPDAAQILNVSRGGIYHLVFTAQVFNFQEDMRALHSTDRVRAGRKTTYLVRRTAVEELARRRNPINEQVTAPIGRV